MRVRRCPICKKKLEARNRNFPFCSARCKLIDVGNWLDDVYRVPIGHWESTRREN